MNLQQKLDELNAVKSGTYYKCTCPVCGEHEAYIYIDDIEKAAKGKRRIPIHCSRLNNCGKTSYIDDLDDLDMSSIPKINKEDFVTAKAVNKTTSLSRMVDYLSNYTMNWRGISNETLKKHGVVYYQKGWSDWMKRCGEGAFPKRFLESKSYEKRDICIPCVGFDGNVERVLLRSSDTTVFPKEMTMLFKQNSTPIWNKQVLKQSSTRIIFVTEGVPDALSVYEYLDKNSEGKYCDVVALPGVGNWKKLMTEIERNKNLNKKFIICFDNDEAGETGYKGIRNKFYEKKIIHQKFNLNSYKDMNEFLKDDRDNFFKSIEDSIEKVSYRIKDFSGDIVNFKKTDDFYRMKEENAFTLVEPFKFEFERRKLALILDSSLN